MWGVNSRILKKKLFFHHFQFMLQILQAIYLYPPRISVWPDRSLHISKSFFVFFKNVHMYVYWRKNICSHWFKITQIFPIYLTQTFTCTLFLQVLKSHYSPAHIKHSKTQLIIFWVLLKILIVWLNNKNWCFT